jgi:hypothetical protein
LAYRVVRQNDLGSVQVAWRIVTFCDLRSGTVQSGEVFLGEVYMIQTAERDGIRSGSHGSETIGAAVAQHYGLVQVAVTFEGVTPILMNAMSEADLLAIRDKVKKPKMAAKPSLRDEAFSKLHRLPDGRPHIPVRCLYATFINAGQFVRLDGKRQISTEKKTVLPGMLSLLDTLLPLVKPGTDEPATWEVDIQQGRNPNGGEAVCIVRPRFDAWSISCTLEIDQSQMPLNLARELVDIAGRRVGLLEYTPRHKGTFGRFNVTAWTVVRKSE